MPPSSSERCYWVGSERFDHPGVAFDRAREIARSLAGTNGTYQDVLVVRSDGDSVRIRGYLDGRGRARSITVPREGRRW